MGQWKSKPVNAIEDERKEAASKAVVEVKYTSTKRGEFGDPVVEKIRLSDLSADVILRVAKDIKMYAKGGWVSIFCDIGIGFAPTHVLTKITPNPELKNCLDGIKIDALRIFGDTAELSDKEKEEWWNEIMHFITYTGLRFHGKSELTFRPLEKIERIIESLKY
jgi:hypothetical protein